MKAAKTSRAPRVAPVTATAPVASRSAEEDKPTERRGLYMMWYDDSAKKPPAWKIEEAVEAYVRHFNARPNTVLVNESDKTDVAGVHVRCTSYVRRDNFWVGYEEAA